jgi:hypothetical protein
MSFLLRARPRGGLVMIKQALTPPVEKKILAS